MKILYWYLALVNTAAFFLCGLDKAKARRHAWRIPEATLMTVAALGGSIGMLLGMLIFHHKTRHKKFTLGVPLLLALQLLAAGWYFFIR